MWELNHLGRVTPGASNATYVAGAGTDVSFDGTVTTFLLVDGGPRVVNMTLSVATSRTLQIRCNSVNMPLNNASPLVANAMYTFAFLANGKDTWSVRFDGDTVINYFTMAVSRN